MIKNEIFYSLSKYEIQAIKQQIKNNKSSYLDIIISFESHEIDKIYRLLSNIYTFEDKESIQYNIWETFLCNKIIAELDDNELICFSHDLQKELRILSSFNIDDFININGKRSTIILVNQIIENQITKKVRIHYFQDEAIIPIGLQKVLNSIFVAPLSFNNMLYTTRNSLNSYYMQTGYWQKYEKHNFEIWNLLHNIEEKAS